MLSTSSSPTESRELAVFVDNGSKYYRILGKYRRILNHLTIKIPSGSIYGLLGPSGCGKTTLLKCFIGRLCLNEGILKIFGKEPLESSSSIPGRLIGFMPQDLSIYSTFTIDQILTFFSYLYQIKSNEIFQRKIFLLEFLNLPSTNSNLSQLSGGQQRRVSLACALIPQPRLLILDEPTVGVDPIIRQKIWKHLIDLSELNRTTIIITTHYIEEAKQAHRIGLMRNGQILDEDSPQELMNKYSKTTLEDVFLHLCHQNDQIHQNSINNKQNRNDIESNNDQQEEEEEQRRRQCSIK